MTTKTAADEMMAAREAIAAALDAKIGNMPEWQAFRAADRALLALALSQPSASKSIPIPRPRLRINDGAPIPYMTLADKALTEADKPLTTAEVVDYIGKHRPLPNPPGDRQRVKITIQSSLSKDERFRSVPWQGGRAWWYANRPVP